MGKWNGSSKFAMYPSLITLSFSIEYPPLGNIDYIQTITIRTIFFSLARFNYLSLFDQDFLAEPGIVAT